ncbi:MAG: hypothetical protein GOMPHAMPRED_002402 [Gomphillus americanus]|uniref:Uncharacterized protein n=1 Tax=Gomphillus americanus TaxID=1940652 RepID=A0A8H3FDU2_9LECA|nr:MAG: hypothetical protein GOMPHAMPRED_002402 [Gomphillus americanus]
MADPPKKAVQKAQSAIQKQAESTNPTVTGFLRSWGVSPAPPTVTATLIAAQHLQPPQFLPLLFPPLLLFSSYLNLADFKVDAAGTTAAWSGLYLLLASRRKQTLRNKWSARGVLRGTSMGLCAMNLVAGGFVYVTGRRANETAIAQAK